MKSVVKVKGASTCVLATVCRDDLDQVARSREHEEGAAVIYCITGQAYE